MRQAGQYIERGEGVYWSQEVGECRRKVKCDPRIRGSALDTTDTLTPSRPSSSTAFSARRFALHPHR
jgi:hypothetical protein